MIFNYELTVNEEEGINDYVIDYNSKVKKPEDRITAHGAMKKVLKQFLKSTFQRVDGKNHKKLDKAFANATAEKKQQVRTILGI